MRATYLLLRVARASGSSAERTEKGDIMSWTEEDAKEADLTVNVDGSDR